MSSAPIPMSSIILRQQEEECCLTLAIRLVQFFVGQSIYSAELIFVTHITVEHCLTLVRISKM